MKHKDGKPIHDKNSRAAPVAIMFLVLCGFSFYLGGIFCSKKDTFVTTNIHKSDESSEDSAVAPVHIRSANFPECSIDYQDYTPCTDPKVILYHYKLT